MKRTVKIVICVLVAVMLMMTTLVGCGISRKLQGVEIRFQQKIQDAVQLSFDMHLIIEDADGKNEIDVSCFKNGDEYAYTFAQPDNTSVVYRRLYADEKLYEFVKRTPVGAYHVTDNVSFTDKNNILYAVKQNIMLVTYATLIAAGKKDTVEGAETYRYDFSYEGNQYSLWYDNENLVKILAVFNTTADDGTVTSETYSAVFSNYCFDNVSTAPFLRPSETKDAVYVDSIIPFEDWMAIISKFSTRAGKWM